MAFFDESSLLRLVSDATFVTAAAGFVGRISWVFASWVIREAEERFSKKPITIEIVVSKLDGVFDKSKTLPQCLLVRYGSDQYLERMASDSEKYFGRLRNEIIDVEVVRDEAAGVINFVLRLPVHQRLGTQFKCFVDVLDRTRLQAAVDFLNQSEQITDVSCSAGPRGDARIYFLLNVPGCAVVKTVEGYENNICFPH